jgi:hypothetical protein
MKVHPDFKADQRNKRAHRMYPETPARNENASLLAKLPAIAPLPTTEDWYWDENGMITF